jgi:hypothetical protein
MQRTVKAPGAKPAPGAPGGRIDRERGIIRSILGDVNMGAADLHRRILELEEQVNNLARHKRELEEKVEELAPRKVLMGTLSSDKPLYWVEA